MARRTVERTRKVEKAVETDAAVLRENRLLRRCFEHLELNPEKVWCPSPDDLALENRQLRHLLQWVCAYRQCPDRAQLEKQGYEFPPVEPDCEPDSDWLVFERWMRGEPLRWDLLAEMEEYGPLDGMSDREVRRALREIERKLADRGVVLELQEQVPPRLVFAYLQKTMKNEGFQYVAPGTTTHVTGCGGWCPGCFQRPWCDTGNEQKWPEDDKAGRMVFPEGVESSA